MSEIADGDSHQLAPPDDISAPWAKQRTERPGLRRAPLPQRAEPEVYRFTWRGSFDGDAVFSHRAAA